MLSRDWTAAMVAEKGWLGSRKVRERSGTGGEGIQVELGWFALEISLREMGCPPLQRRKKNAFVWLHGL